MIPSAALVAALMSDKELSACIANTGQPPAAYIANFFEFHKVTLYSGERIVVAMPKTECLVSQNSAVFVYREVGGSYRLVLRDNALPDSVDASPNGTISLEGHDTIDTVVESVYVWNGSSYVFAPERSEVQDVTVGLTRPMEVRVRFAQGTSSTVLRGSYAENFGQTYSFIAKAGQTATIELLEYHGHTPAMALRFGDRDVADVDHRWSGALQLTGKYTLDVFGLALPDHRTLVPYGIRLTIR